MERHPTDRAWHKRLYCPGLLSGIDARWAVVCTQLSDKLQQAGGRENPRYLPAARRIARALYFDYSIQDDFYPQFNANTQALWPLLDKML